MTEADRDTLRTLAAAVSAHVEVRRQSLAAAERHGELLAVIEHAPDAYVCLDPDSEILGVNARTEALLGWERDMLVGLRAHDVIIPPDARAGQAAALAEATATRGASGLPDGPLEIEVRHRDGTLVPVELTIGATETPRGMRFTVFMRDISDRIERRRERQVEADELAALADVTSLLARGLDDAVLRDQLCEAAAKVTGADSATLFVAHGDGGLIASGATSAELRGLTIAPGAHSLCLDAYNSKRPVFTADAVADGYLLAQRHAARAIAVQPVLLDGRCFGVLAVYWTTPLPALGTRTARLLGLLAHEASTAFARTALFARLAEQSRTDALTGVLNRRALDDELHLALLNARRDGGPVSVAVLDLDHFKGYNDTFGHTAGDTLLKGACAAWTQTLRGGDVLARFGGEEFVVVLPGCATPDAGALIDRLRAGTPNGQTCSAGVATWDGAEALGDLLERADQALYRAKGAGRDQVCLA
jgi:diguanylate cyclase (GGDEF)-like protein/PAS domain S-box-containing protein